MGDLRQLGYFLAVVEEGQISAAARRLCLAQPALSQSVRALERSVGVELLVRHPHGVSPTTAGERFAEGVRATLATYERTLAEARELAPNHRLVTLGAISVTPGLGELVRAFRTAHPDLAVRWIPTTFDRDGRNIAEGEVDVAVALPEYRYTDVSTATLFELPVQACVAVGHRLASLRTLRVEDLADETFPAQPPGVSNEFADLFILTAHFGSRPRQSPLTPPTLTPDDTWSLIASGRAITTTPKGAELWSQEPIAVRPIVDVPPFKIRIMWRNDANAATATFVSFARQRYSAQAVLDTPGN